jgi:gluconolactonase
MSDKVLSQMNKNVFEKVADGLNFPEGPAWDGNGSVYVSSCYGGYITKITKDSSYTFLKASEEPFTLKQTNGLTFDRFGNLYACEYGIGAILKISGDAKTEIYASGYNGKKFNRPNDLAFDPKGNLYFTDPKSYDKNNPDGNVFRIDARTREVTIAADSIAFSNGIAFSADGNNVFVCESANHRILKFEINKDGTFTNKKVFATLPDGDPDGIAFDIEGNLYVANFGSGRIYILNPDGSIKNYLEAPSKNPSNVEFADGDLKTLYITEDETNSVYKTKVNIPGLPLFNSPIHQNN